MRHNSCEVSSCDILLFSCNLHYFSGVEWSGDFTLMDVNNTVLSDILLGFKRSSVSITCLILFKVNWSFRPHHVWCKCGKTCFSENLKKKKLMRAQKCFCNIGEGFPLTDVPSTGSCSCVLWLLAYFITASDWLLKGFLLSASLCFPSIY